MRRARFSFTGTLAAVAATGVALAALREATEFWLGAVTTLSSIGMIVAWRRLLTGPNRAFWAGGAIASGLYLLLVFVPWFHVHLGPQLWTDRLLDRAHAGLGVQPRARIEHYDRTGRVVARVLFDARDGSAEREATRHWIGSGGSYQTSGSGLFWDLGGPNPPARGPSRITSALIRDDREVFRRIGHVLIAWALAVVAGVVGLAFRSLLRRLKATSPDPAMQRTRLAVAHAGPSTAPLGGPVR